MTARAIVLAGMMIVLAGCEFDIGPGDKFKSDFHYSYDLNPGGRVEVEAFNGGIEIDGEDQNKVEISGTKYGSTEQLRDAVKINISPSPDSIVIRAERPSDSRGSCGARFTIHVPKNAVVSRVTSTNGGVHVSAVDGDGHFRTSNGSIRLSNLRGSIDAKTSNGGVDVSDIRGDAILHTSNGKITADDIGGNVEAETSNGAVNITLDHSPTSPVKLETSNGAIELTMREKPKADVRAITVNSAITIHLPADTAARVSATTSNGSISSDFDIAGGMRPKNHLDGPIGGGGPSITLVTSNGAIRIEKGVGH